MGVMSKTQAELAEQKYRPLKKMMKKTFKKMKDCMDRNELPSRALIEDFMAETTVMVSYPGFGDDHYQDFIEACIALKQACDTRDFELFSERLAKISRIKKACHGMFR